MKLFRSTHYTYLLEIYILINTTTRRVHSFSTFRAPRRFSQPAPPIETPLLNSPRLSIEQSTRTSSRNLLVQSHTRSAGRLLLHVHSNSHSTPRMPRGVKKENLPSKVCITCGRPFTWRKKWEKCWDEVSTCSKSCNRKRRENNASDRLLKKHVVELSGQDELDGDIGLAAETERSSSCTERNHGSNVDEDEDEDVDVVTTRSDVTRGEGLDGIENAEIQLEHKVEQMMKELNLASGMCTPRTTRTTTIMDGRVGEDESENNSPTSMSMSTTPIISSNDNATDGETSNNLDLDPDPNDIEDPVARKKALRKAEKKRKKQERRAQREGRGDTSAGQKECDMCHKSVDMLVRCTYDESLQWKMVCGKCWNVASGGVVDGDAAHPYYKYGGLWKNRRRK